MASYLLSGVVLEADRPLSGLRPSSASELSLADGLPHLRFEPRAAGSLRAPQHWLQTRPFPDEETPWLSVGRVPEGYFIRVHGHADFVFDPRVATIFGSGSDDGAAEVVDQLLVDQVLPQVLHAMGRFAIHASSVEWQDGVAVGFAGKSGAGKSTLAASLSKMRRLLGDDCLAITFAAGDARAHPSYAALRLCSDSARALFGPIDRFPSASPRTDKLRVDVDGAAGTASLRAIYLLERTDGAVSLQPLGRRDAVTRLASFVYRLDPDDRRRLAEELDFLERLVRQVAVARLLVPHRFEAINAVGDLVSRHLAASP